MSSLSLSASALTTQQRLMWQQQQPQLVQQQQQIQQLIQEKQRLKQQQQQQQPQLVQQQQQMRAKSLEKELEPEPSMRQYIKDNPTPESIAEEKKDNNKVSAASVHELLYQDPIDYIFGGEHLVDAFKSYKPLLRSNNEYIKLYGINVEEIVEENDDLAYDSVIDSINKVIIKGNYESSTMFKDKKKCSVTTITQEQAQIKQEQELQEDYNNIKEINTKNNNNNVFNELITYYNYGGSDLKQKKINDYFS